jgi:hypothetical protein
MTEYRLSCLNEAGKFAKSYDIEAAPDEEAIKEARQLKLPVVCELWERSRMVAKLEPHKAF